MFIIIWMLRENQSLIKGHMVKLPISEEFNSLPNYKWIVLATLWPYGWAIRANCFKFPSLTLVDKF